MLETVSTIESGRQAYAAAEWSAAYERFASVRPALGVDDLALLARCAWLLSRIPEALELSEELFAGYRDEDRAADAASTALLLALLWITRGEASVGSGWLNRARRLLSELPDSAQHGYLAYIDAMVALQFGGAAEEPLRRLSEIAERFNDPALDALELAASGLADVRRGATDRGFARLDEAMLPVIAGRVPVEWAGDIYCTVIHVCHQLGDFARMTDWTSATERWCRQFASEAVYRGICRVHRLELRGAHGDWSDVEAELVTESQALLPSSAWVAGEGFYQLGEIRRVRGDDSGAREAYAAARDAGIDPQPGEALLMLKDGRIEDAWTALSASTQARERVARVRLLRAGVEIGIAAGRITEAEELAAQLRQAAKEYRSPGFAAWAAHAEGMLALNRGSAHQALAALQSAAAAFRLGRQPYETARVLLAMARAHALAGERALADRDLAEARGILGRLGAVDGTAPTQPDPTPVRAVGPLTAREGEVLACVATGASNRDAAAQLFISEKTVGRHLANIYVKLGVGSRTAAAAWWREHTPGSAH